MVYQLNVGLFCLAYNIVWLDVISVKSAICTVAISKDNVYIFMYFYIHFQ